MNKALLLALGLLAVCAAAFAGGEKDAAQSAVPKTGLEKGIAIMLPETAGFTQEGDFYLPDYVRNVLTNTFVKYSGMTVNNEGDTRDYYLEVHVQRHSPTRYSLSMEVKTTGVGDVLAASRQSASSLNDLMYGRPLNLAAKDLLTSPGLGVNLTAADRKQLDEYVDSKYLESVATLVKTPESSFGKEQNANVAEDLGASLANAGLQLSDSSSKPFELPEFNTPQFTAVTFRPPAIRAFSTSAPTGAALQADLAAYRTAQAESKAAIEEQQKYLIGQRADILDQWQNFLGEIDKRREFLRGEEKKLFEARRALETQLREGEAYYRDAPPFRILYTPEPTVVADLERGTANFGYRIAAEPTSVRALKVRIDNLFALNKSFANVNKAFEDVNTAIDERFPLVEAAMAAVKDAMERANAAGSALGQGYKVDPVSTTSADWRIPPGSAVNGTAPRTSWPVDYPRQFTLTVCLLSVSGDEANVIERGTLTLDSDFSWNGPLKPESASARGTFDNVKIDDIPEEGSLAIWIEKVNGKDAETAALEGYIEIIPDGRRTAAVSRQAAARESRRRFWSDTRRLNSLGVAAGTTGGLRTPLFLASAKLTFSPLPYMFLEAGSDFGLLHGERSVKGVEYLSIAPYLHLNALGAGRTAGVYIGIGGGASFSQYSYPSESRINPVTVFTPVFDFNLGLLFFPPHSVIDVRWTIKKGSKELDHRFTLGYAYRFGYQASRYGGKPADLTNRNFTRNSTGNSRRSSNRQGSSY
ncbi:MAG: hypothetical protein LBJ86_05175 [Spirochaetaceae bacterium]|jgi:hypothetical protein|nr:hypothetical protein [Spirochaetaceae bacterium]